MALRLMLAPVLVLFVGGGAWWTLDRIEATCKEDTVSYLRSVLKMAQRNFDSRLVEIEKDALYLASSPDMVRLVKDLASSSRQGEPLAELRALWQADRNSKNRYRGFHVIADDFTVLASMRNEDIGAVDFSAVEKEFLAQLFSGGENKVDFLFSGGRPPSGESGTAERKRRMFAAAPVRDDEGKAAAVLVLEVDCEGVLFPVFNSARIGETGETILFDKSGRLLTESRFEDQLRSAGLLPAGKSSVLNVELRDPGGDTTAGFRPPVPRDKQPLTYAAANAIRRTGLDHDVGERRDYRGVPVIGAWTWDIKTNVGMIVKIDVMEMCHGFKTARTLVVGLLTLASSIFIGFLAFLSVKHNREHALAEAVREKERRLQAVMDNAGEGIITIDERGDVESFNPAAEIIFSCTAGEIAGKPMSTLIPEFRRSKFSERIKHCLEPGTDKAAGKEQIEVNARRKTGEIFPVELTIGEAFVGPKHLYIAVLRDIGQRKKMENRVVHLFQAVEQSPCSVIITDTAGNIEYVNPKFTELSGYAAEEAIGRNPRFLKDSDRDNESYRQLWETIASGKEWTGEFRNRRKNGDRYYGLASISALRNTDGVITNYLSVMEDITERKLSEEKVISSLKEKEVLLKEVHHRTKNNLQIVSSLIKLQSRSMKDGKSLEILADMQSRIQSISLVHNGIYASPDLNKVDSQAYFSTLGKHLLRSYATGQTRVALTVDAHDVWLGIDTGIYCGLIVNELISNSLKYAFPMKPSGEIGVSLCRPGADVLELTVWDDGVGLPPDLDPRKTASLGLQLIMTLAEEQLRGSVEVGRARGTSYKIVFPATRN